MLSYMRLVAICESVRATIKRAFSQSDDMNVRLRASNITTTESVLRAVSLVPNLDTEEKLKEFIMEHILSSLRLTAAQREHLNLNS